MTTPTARHVRKRNGTQRIDLTPLIPASITESVAETIETGEPPGWIHMYGPDADHFGEKAAYIEYRVGHAEKESRPVSLSFSVRGDLPGEVRKPLQTYFEELGWSFSAESTQVSFNCYISSDGEVLQPTFITKRHSQ